MAEIVKIKNIGLHKLNNAEYTNFAQRTVNLIHGAGESALGIRDEDLARYVSLLGTMQDIVAQSRISGETAELLAADKERDELGVYLLASIRSERHSPVELRRKAAQQLYNATKPYIGFQRMPYQQETATLNGLLLDLSKADNAEAIGTLGKADVVAALKAANDRYANLTDQRTASRDAARIGSAKGVREDMDKLYDQMMTAAFVHSVAFPTAAATNFVSLMNALIYEVNALYNQRMAPKGPAAGGPQDAPPEENPGSETVEGQSSV